MPPDRVSAPGKLLLLGEYAVVESGRALVAAVDRRAAGHLSEDAPAPSPHVAAVLARAQAEGYAAPSSGVTIDTSSFHAASGLKLGLGSSAAATAVATALITGRVDASIYALAIEAHRDAAGGIGSGVDVATCLAGGVLATGRQPSVPEVLPSSCPGLVVIALFADQSASTGPMVARCQASPGWARHVAALSELAEEGIAAWRRGAPEAVIEVAGQYGRAMQALGDEAGAPIVTPEIARVMAAAEALGAAAKPSGAGGGDIVLVLAKDSGIATQVARVSGLTEVPMTLGAPGLRFDP